MKAIAILIMIFSSLTMTAQSPEVFLPGIVSTDSVDFNACFSPDGSFLFSRTINKRSRIMICTKAGDSWSTPEALSFSRGGFSDADPAFSPDGELYFISNRPVDNTDTIHDYNIWKVKPLSGARWSTPIDVEALNSSADEYYISFTGNGDAYFSSSRTGGFGEEDIYYSEWKNNTFATPRNAGPVINTIHSEYDPFITTEGMRLIFASSGRSDSYGKADLYWSVRSGGKWEQVNHFDKNVNTDTRDYCPYIGKDNFFWSSGGNVKWITLPRFLEEKR